MKQNSLFPLEDFSKPPSQPTPTSVAAADAIKPDAGRLRRIVYEWLLAHGPATDEEIIAGTGLSPNTARPRRIELVQSGQVLDSGTTKKTASGRQAVAWTAKV